MWSGLTSFNSILTLRTQNVTARPHRQRDAAGHVMQWLGNHCYQLGCSHTQHAAVCANNPTENSGFQDIAFRDVLPLCAAYATCVGGALPEYDPNKNRTGTPAALLVSQLSTEFSFVFAN